MKIVSVKKQTDNSIVMTTDAGHQAVFPLDPEKPDRIIPADGAFDLSDLRAINDLLSDFRGWMLSEETAVVLSDDFGPCSYMALDTNDNTQHVLIIPATAEVDGLPVTRIARTKRGDIWVEPVTA